MLRSLFPRCHRKFASLPLLGPIADGFDDWLTTNGYTRGSRKFSIHMLPHVDAYLRRVPRVPDVASLTHAKLHTCWRDLIKFFPAGAGTVRTLERYLVARELIVPGHQTTTPSQTLVLSEKYVKSPSRSTGILYLHHFKPSAYG